MNPPMRSRYAAEFIGTFVIVFAPVAFTASDAFAGGGAGLIGAAWVSGLAVLAMVYALGHISAAHFNPAVTLGFAAAGRFPWRYVLPYWLAEFAGGIAAAGTCGVVFGPGYGTHVPTFSAVQALALEAVLTFFLMLVIISVATDRRVNEAVPGLAIGLTVVFDVLIGGPVSGGSMNPARSLGPALFAHNGARGAVWIYFVGPMIGATAASLLYEAIRGGSEHAQGAPNDLFVALEQVSDTT